jgi:DMSO/TMAO reductase YedYZ molybdopterin-dependent catalytic subunit
MEASEKQNRIVEARMKLKARFEEKMKNTPSVSDNKPTGTGKLNRHGMPEPPVGQTITTKWPVLDLGFQPDVSLKEWKLILDGEVEHPTQLSERNNIQSEMGILPKSENTELRTSTEQNE